MKVQKSTRLVVAVLVGGSLSCANPNGGTSGAECLRYESASDCEAAGCSVYEEGATTVHNRFWEYSDGGCEESAREMVCLDVDTVGGSDVWSAYWRERDDGSVEVFEIGVRLWDEFEKDDVWTSCDENQVEACSCAIQWEPDDPGESDAGDMNDGGGEGDAGRTSDASGDFGAG